MRDAEMLRKFNLMDYSLLLCITENPDFKPACENQESSVFKRMTLISNEVKKNFYADCKKNGY